MLGRFFIIMEMSFGGDFIMGGSEIGNLDCAENFWREIGLANFRNFQCEFFEY